jgi:hypothetical protein
MKMKTYKTFHSFKNAVCKAITKSKHDRVLFTLVTMGYAERIESSGKVIYGFLNRVSATQEDVEKVVNQINARR